MVVANIALPIVVAWILAALFWFALRLGDRSRSLLTQRLRPRPPSLAAYAGIALTLAFNLATSLLFFATVNQIFPWYSDGVGG